MYKFLLDNNLLYKYQSGFLPDHSTVFQLIDIFHNIYQAFDNNMFSCIVFCDVSKAFDRVWHKGLLIKLRQNGIEGKLLEWLNSYLSQRKQKVGLKSCFSCLKSIFAGVPQGSVLGHLLFLVYINDIAEHLLSLTRLFADDSSLFYSAAHIDDIAGIINHDMQLLSNWARQWLVTFNPLKTEAVLFTLKKINILPQLVFDNIPINFVDSHKHLGVTFSSTGQWHSHIENIVLSATKILGIMSKLKYSISRNALNQMYMSFLLPLVEYASVVWDGCSEQDSQTLQKIQNEAACLVTGLTRSVSLENLFKECGWTTLSKRRQQHKLSFMYKVNNGIVRNNCSNLNNDIFRNHLRDNPLCDLCGMIEDAIHYFFHCRKFTLERQVFNDTVRVFQTLSIDMILCGNFNLNMENNIVLFRAVHRYIHATKRFKTS